MRISAQVSTMLEQRQPCLDREDHSWSDHRWYVRLADSTGRGEDSNRRIPLRVKKPMLALTAVAMTITERRITVWQLLARWYMYPVDLACRRCNYLTDAMEADQYHGKCMAWRLRLSTQHRAGHTRSVGQHGKLDFIQQHYAYALCKSNRSSALVRHNMISASATVPVTSAVPTGLPTADRYPCPCSDLSALTICRCLCRPRLGAFPCPPR